MGTAAAARLLMQGTMGTSPADINAAAAQTYDAWFASQAAAKPSLEAPRVSMLDIDRRAAWWNNAVNGPDQLRQRIAFALSEIFVVSKYNFSEVKGRALANYYDLLATDALGNFRTLLGDVSASPVMGQYLTYFKNDIPDPKIGSQADENYAREIMQLFTIGLWQLNADGTQQLDANSKPIPTYSQSDVSNLARVFTGWASHPVGSDSGEVAWKQDMDLFNPMACYPTHHDPSSKTIVGGVVIAGGGSCEADMAAALDTLFNHPNTGPFIAKQLIERLVSSNPSPQYVGRVAKIFANNGQGVRGDMLAVTKAILTDPEAIAVGTSAGSGRLREPLLRVTALWRAFSAAQRDGTFSEAVAGDPQMVYGQSALKAPTVFNFFTPAYQPPGPISAAGLVAPEFQITNESTAILTANKLQTFAYQFVSASGVSSGGIGGTGSVGNSDMLLHTAAWEGYAADAQALITELELVFMPGQMSSAMRNTLVGYVNAIPASSRANRAIEAASLILSSPQYSIQR